MRTLISTLGAVTWLGAMALAVPAPTHAGAATLKILRDARGSVSQIIPLESWTLDAARGVLEVDSVGGGRVCAGAPVGAASRYMVLDGNFYGVEKIEEPTGPNPVITVSPVRKGVFPLCSSGRSATMAGGLAKGPVNGLMLELDVIRGSQRSASTVPAVGSIVYRPGASPSLQIASGEPLICVQGQPSAGGQMTLTDTNNQPAQFSGVSAVRYRPASGAFTVDLGDGLSCFAQAPSTSFAAERSSAVPCAQVLTSDEVVFSSGFGAPGQDLSPTASGLGLLQFDLRLVQPPSLDGETLIYDYVVQNCGADPLVNVVLQEFWPGSGGSAVPNVDQNSTWKLCGESADGCGAAAPQPGYVQATLGNLPAFGEPGSRAVIRATRALTDGLANDLLRVDAVAVIDAGSAPVPENQTKAWEVPVLLTGNDPPVLEVATGSVDAAPPVGEDAAAVAITGADTFTLRASDQDESGFDCAGPCFEVTTSDAGIIAPGDVQVEFSVETGGLAGTLALSVSPRANAFGPVTISVRAVDTEGGASNAVAIPLEVTPVNDPPTFEIAQGFDRTGAGKAITRTGSVYCTLVQTSANGPFVLDDVDCPAQRWEANPTFPADGLVYTGWIDDVSGGPGDGDNATVSVAVAEDPQGIIEALVFDADPSSPEFGSLTYALQNGAKGTATLRITAEDDSAASTVIDLEVSVDNAPPVITSEDGAETAFTGWAENNGGVILTVTATDADDPPSALRFSVSGEDADDFLIDEVTGELRFAAAPDFEAPTDANADNLYRVNVVVTDGVAQDSQAWSIDVVDVPE